MNLPDPVLEQMQTLIERWQAQADRRAIFLRCYRMMTANVLQALERSEFGDPAWVDALLRHFADYYFVALDMYQRDPFRSPRVWQAAHYAALHQPTAALQILLLGVNAHINYDLVFALADQLTPEWAGLSADQRAERYRDHCQINHIIGRTIDAVQDDVLEPAMPVMEWVDALFGRADEWMISGLIANWRETVWENAIRLLESVSAEEKQRIIDGVEKQALRTTRRIVPFMRFPFGDFDEAEAR